MIDRRSFVASVGGALISIPLLGSRRAKTAIRAVAFDGFAIFDATRVAGVAEAIVPGRGRELAAAWRTRLFEYQWLRTLGGRYADFRHTADDALGTSVAALGLQLTADERARLLEAQVSLVPWPDAADAVRALRAAGLRLAFLSNMTEQMLADGARRAGLRDQFELVLSTDRVRAAKPDPRAYGMALDAFGMRREEIAFVAFAPWDAAGATWFGYPTVWMNRASQPAEALDATPALVTHDLAGVVAFATSSR